MRLGVYGGTFNPPHLGHVMWACEAHAALGLDRLLLMPAARPPHKDPAQVAPKQARLELCRAAIAGHEGLEVSDLEFRRRGRSYTADTLRILANEHPGCEMVLLVGDDQALVLDTWHEAAELAQLATIAVMPRPGAFSPLAIEHRLGKLGARAVMLDGPRIELSSTLIRERVTAGLRWRHLVPPGVAEVIDRFGLYRGATAAA